MEIKNVIIAALAIVAVAGWVAFARKDSNLPTAPTDFGGEGTTVFQAIQNRASTSRSDFTRDAVSDEDLRTLAWAASGKNRDGQSGYTVPLAMASDPYVDIYLFDAAGIRLYDWDADSFAQASETDARADIMMMSELADIPDIMVFVIDPDKLPGGNPDPTYGYIAVGAMSQNVYLMAQELGIQRRYIASIQADAIKSVLGLDDNALPVGAMILAQGQTAE